MLKILRSDVEEFIKLVEAVYGKGYILNREYIYAFKYQGGYLFNYYNIYYQVEAFEYEKTLGENYEEKAVEFSFALHYFLFERIVSMHRNRGDEYIVFDIENNKINGRKRIVVKTIFDYLELDIDYADFDTFNKCFEIELETKDLMEYIRKNNKITVKIKVLNKVDIRNYHFYYPDQMNFENFINYYNTDTVMMYYDKDAYIRIDKAFFGIFQWKDEDLD